MNSSAGVTQSGIGNDPDLGEHFRVIAELGGDVAWSLDCATGLPRYISPGVEQLLGFSVDELYRQFGDASPDGPLAALCGGLPARLQRFADGDLTRLRVVREYDQLHKDGRIVPIEVISTLILEHGVALALVGVVRDLSDRRACETEQRRFASMLNHEFRTPLSTIDGAIQRLEVTGTHADEPTRARYRKIAIAVDRLIGMLDEYLSPERMEALGRQRQPTSIAPRQLLEEGAAQVRAAGRRVHVDIGELPARLRCEPEGLRLAMKVLLDNAIQFSPPDTDIGLAGQCAGGGIELRVADAGPGVPDDEAQYIFDKFYRGSNAAGLPGSGLGLYMARAVVEVHGGTLSWANKAGFGTEFRIWLPAKGN